jgi:hypothetical protein
MVVVIVIVVVVVVVVVNKLSGLQRAHSQVINQAQASIGLVSDTIGVFHGLNALAALRSHRLDVLGITDIKSV